MPVTNIRLDPKAGHVAQEGELVPKRLNVSLPEEPQGAELPPSADPDFEGPATVQAVPVTVALQPRHAEWLAGHAAREGITPEQALERLVKAACARDPYRQVSTLPLGPGYGAGTGRR